MSHDIMSTIKASKIMCLDTGELIQVILGCCPYEDMYEIISIITHDGRNIPIKSQEEILVFANKLVDEVKTSNSNRTKQIFREINQLRYLLAGKYAEDLAICLLSDRRKACREISYKIFKQNEYSIFEANNAKKLWECFKNFQDQHCLKLIATNPKALTTLDVGLVIKDIDESYWRMKAFASLVSGSFEPLSTLAEYYPLEFIWAVGQTRKRKFLSEITTLFKKHCTNEEIVSKYAWALGRLNGQRELDELEKWYNTQHKVGKI